MQARDLLQVSHGDCWGLLPRHLPRAPPAPPAPTRAPGQEEEDPHGVFHLPQVLRPRLQDELVSPAEATLLDDMPGGDFDVLKQASVARLVVVHSFVFPPGFRRTEFRVKAKP